MQGSNARLLPRTSNAAFLYGTFWQAPLLFLCILVWHVLASAVIVSLHPLTLTVSIAKKVLHQGKH